MDLAQHIQLTESVGMIGNIFIALEKWRYQLCKMPPDLHKDLKDIPHYRILINNTNGFGRSTAYIPEKDNYYGIRGMKLGLPSVDLHLQAVIPEAINLLCLHHFLGCFFTVSAA